MRQILNSTTPGQFVLSVKIFMLFVVCSPSRRKSEALLNYTAYLIL